jgi:hypothetical protein
VSWEKRFNVAEPKTDERGPMISNLVIKDHILGLSSTRAFDRHSLLDPIVQHRRTLVWARQVVWIYGIYPKDIHPGFDKESIAMGYLGD